MNPSYQHEASKLVFREDDEEIHVQEAGWVNNVIADISKVTSSNTGRLVLLMGVVGLMYSATSAGPSNTLRSAKVSSLEYTGYYDLNGSPAACPPDFGYCYNTCCLSEPEAKKLHTYSVDYMPVCPPGNGYCDKCCDYSKAPTTAPTEAPGTDDSTAICATGLGTETVFQPATVTCPANQYISKIVFASFGMPTGTCGNYEVSGDSDCNSDWSTKVVSESCLGKTTCSVSSSHGTFGGAQFCPTDIYLQHLYIQVECSELDSLHPLATECAYVSGGETGTVTCPEGYTIESMPFASFGSPQGDCGAYVYNSCNNDIIASVDELCVGKSTCSVLAAPSSGSDTCSDDGGFNEHLALQALCTFTGSDIATAVNPDSVATVEVVAPHVSFATRVWNFFHFW